MHGGGASVLLPLVSSTAVVPGPPDVSPDPDDPPVVDPELVPPPLDPPPLDPPPSDVVGTTPVSLELALVVVTSSEVAPVIAPVAVPPPPGEPQEATAVHEHTPRTIERARIMARTIARPRVHDRAPLDLVNQLCKNGGGASMTEARRTPDGREERGDRTAQALLVAAQTAFSRGGYAAASVRDIARAAGVNPALVRYHFGSKEGLYRKVIDEAMSGLRTRLLAAFHQAGTPRERIHRVIGAYLDHLAQERDFPRLIQRALLNNDPHLRRVAHEYLHPLVDTLRPFVGRRPAGTLGNLEEVIVSVFGAIIAPFLYEPLLGDLFRRDVLSPAALKRRRRHIEALVELTLTQLLPETL